jgi:hypothetical protein
MNKIRGKNKKIQVPHMSKKVKKRKKTRKRKRKKIK